MDEHGQDQGASREELAAAESKGLYRSAAEHDACGVGFVAHIAGSKSHSIWRIRCPLIIRTPKSIPSGFDSVRTAR